MSSLFLAFLLFRTDLGETRDALTKANYAYVAPTVALLFATLWVRSARWAYLLRPITSTGAAPLYPLVTVGLMANNVLPVRAGELVRAYLLGGRKGISRVSVLATIAVERLFDGIVLVGFFLIFGPFVGLNDTLSDLAIVMAVAFAAGVVVVFIVVWSEERSERLARGALSRLPRGLRGRAGDSAASFLVGLRGLRSAPVLAPVLATSILVWIMEAGAYYMMGRAFSIDAGFEVYLVVAAAANLAISVPSSQGGIGPFEFFARETMVVAGAGSGVATAYAVALHAVILLPVVVAGLIFVWLTDITIGGALGREPGERAATGGVPAVSPEPDR